MALVLLLVLLTLDLDLNRIVRLRDPVWSFWEEGQTSSLFATESGRRNRSHVWKTCEENLKLPNEVKEIRSKNHIVIISTVSRSFTEVEVTRCGYLPSCEVARWISYTFIDVEVGYFFFRLYHLENKKIVYFCQYTEEWYIKEIKLLTRTFFSSAAEKWIDLNNAAGCNVGFWFENVFLTSQWFTVSISVGKEEQSIALSLANCKFWPISTQFWND